jgi:hypothetical protein
MGYGYIGVKGGSNPCTLNRVWLMEGRVNEGEASTVETIGTVEGREAECFKQGLLNECEASAVETAGTVGEGKQSALKRLKLIGKRGVKGGSNPCTLNVVWLMEGRVNEGEASAVETAGTVGDGKRSALSRDL